MDDLLAHRGAGERVLDLGSGAGSFPYQRYSCQIIAIDTHVRAGLRPGMDRPPGRSPYYVQGRGAALPLSGNSVDVVIASHLFEHLADPAVVVREVARVLRPSGVLFATVPEGASFSDRCYRFWTRGGGHLQHFSFRRFQEIIEQNTDMELLYARRLYSSFSFLHPHPEMAMHLPRRSQLLKYLPLWARDAGLGTLNAVTRVVDALAGTRLSRYGWACYFLRPAARLLAVNRQEYLNVCSRCGAGHPSAELQPRRFRWYRCPQCGCWNPFFGGWFTKRITAQPWDEEEHHGGERLPGLSSMEPAEIPSIPGTPQINPGGVVNAASYISAVSPGSLIAVFGSSLGGSDTTLLVNGCPVPLLSVSQEQVTAYLPPELPRGSATFQVVRGDMTSPPLICPLLLTSPGLFSRDATGQGIAVVLPSPGSSRNIRLLATGLGPVTPDGRTTRSCQVWIGGKRATVGYAGLRQDAPSPGVYEVSLEMPGNTAGRAVPVQIVIGGRGSNILTLAL